MSYSGSRAGSNYGGYGGYGSEASSGSGKASSVSGSEQASDSGSGGSRANSEYGSASGSGSGSGSGSRKKSNSKGKGKGKGKGQKRRGSGSDSGSGGYGGYGSGSGSGSKASGYGSGSGGYGSGSGSGSGARGRRRGKKTGYASKVKPKELKVPKFDHQIQANFDNKDPETDPVCAHESPAANAKMPAKGFYVDEAFGPQVALKHASKPMEWTHIFDITSKKRELVTAGADANDIKQGALGDCWLLGAMSVVAARRGLLDNVVVRNPANEAKGLFTFQFYKFGDWREVTVDGNLPTYKKKTAPSAYGRGQDPDEMWVPLLEKAYAKFHGCYAQIEGGWGAGGMLDLTGGFPFSYYLTRESDKSYPDKKEKARLWAELQGFEKDCVFAAGTIKKSNVSAGGIATNEVDNGKGIIGGHAYGILDFVEWTDPAANKAYKLVKVRNPWGQGEWKGDFGDHDPRWKANNGALARDLKHKVGEDGTFFMTWDDFLSAFNRIDALHLQNDWSEEVIYGMWAESIGTINTLPHTMPGGTDKHPCFALNVTKKGRMHLLVERPDPRQMNGMLPPDERRKITLPHLIIALYNGPPEHDQYPISCVKQVGYFGTLYMDNLDPGEYYVLVYQYGGAAGHYCLSVAMSKGAKFTLEPIIEDEKLATVKQRKSNEAKGHKVNARKIVQGKGNKGKEPPVLSGVKDGNKKIAFASRDIIADLDDDYDGNEGFEDDDIDDKGAKVVTDAKLAKKMYKEDMKAIKKAKKSKK